MIFRDINKDFTGGKYEWRTPSKLFDELHDKYEYNLDACATPENALLPQYLTSQTSLFMTDKEFLGGRRVFCNPPYDSYFLLYLVNFFEARCYNPLAKPDFMTLLLPAKTDQKWFQTLWRWYYFSPVSCKIEWVQGRLKFSGEKNTARFPSFLFHFSGGLLK